MDYKKLPLEKRIQLATKYALLQMAGLRSKKKIIGILKQDYALTDEQALQVFNTVQVVKSSSTVSNNVEFEKTMYPLAVLSFLLLCIFSYQYFFSTNTIRQNEIVTIGSCIISAPVTRERTSGKHKQNYYLLSCRGRNVRFRFYENFYSYSSKAGELATIWPGDTITVQILQEDLGFYNDRDSYVHIDAVNLDLGKGFLIDHAYRNARIIESDRSVFYILLTVFGGIVLVIIVQKVCHYIDHR